MAGKRSQLAKLTRPRLHKAVARERLFKLLDEKREYPVVWIVGPPGAGKTTLAASYLEEARVPAIWYQMDPGDSDPATFFYYMKQAIEALAKRKGKPLPLLTPEYLPDLPAFARRFLRECFARLPDDVLMVFDNYHEIASDSALHAAFQAGLAEAPPNANIFVLSRSDPPSVLSQLIVNQTISLVTWEDLRLTPEEAVDVAAARGLTDPGLARNFHIQTDGWIAGLTLMLERSGRGGVPREAVRAQTLETVFDYFASVIFEQSSPEARDVMLRTALLPRMNAMVVESITGNPGAICHVDSLHRRHLFTSRMSSGTADTYQYHALFHAFLRARARAVLPESERRAITRRAAMQAETESHFEEAFALFAGSEEWAGAERIVVAQAPTLIAQGRWQTLQEWGKAMPAERTHGNPWLEYWIGRSQIPVQPQVAIKMLEAAYARFCCSGDKTGELMSAVGALDALFFEFTNFPAMDPWIARVVESLERGVTLSNKEDDLRVHAAVMLGATYRAPKHSMLEASVRRVKSLIFEPFHPNLKVTVASMLHAYGNMAVDFEAEDIASRVARPILNAPELTGAVAMFYLGHEGYTHYVHGRYQQGLACFDRVEAIAAEHGLRNITISMTWRGLCERRAGLIDQAEASVRRIEASGNAPIGYVAALFQLLKGSVAFARNDLERASSTILAAYDISHERGSFNGSMLIGTVAANFNVAAGKMKAARDLLDRLNAQAQGPLAENYGGAIRLNQAWLEHREANAAARTVLLRDCLHRARDVRQRFRYRWYGNALSDLLPIALSEEIEPDIAIQLAREFDVIPSGTIPDDWPWPVKIYTLGRFELLLDNKPPQYSRKVPRTVLALLKAIIAYGGHEVPEEKLIDALWPDDDGDAGRRSLTATLHRLRKLLVNGNAIRQAGGALTLDRRFCWVDAVAFDERLDRKVASDTDDAALLLYRGAFLAHEENVPWAVLRRERLRAKFVQVVGKRGASLETAGSYEQAIELYARGIEADSLIETFYQGLMRCYDRLDRRTEAVSVYRRLRQTLSVTLGVPPSSATQRLFETLRLN